MRPNLFFFFIFSYLIFEVSCYAQEGNYNFEHFGNQSSLLTGNVIASGTDLALSFYNPSRLSFSEDKGFIINVKAYQYNQFEFTDNLDDISKSSNDQFNAIPSIVAGKFKLKFLPNHDFSYTFISRYRSSLNFDYNSGVLEINDSNNDLQNAFLNLGINDDIKDEWLGLTWSYKFNDNFGIGISSFLSIYELNSRSDVTLSNLNNDDSVSLSTSQLNYSQNTYGLFFKIGGTWNFSKMNIGFNISLPHINLRKEASLTLQEFSSGFGDEDVFSLRSYDDLNNLRRTAMSIETGIQYNLGKHRIHGKLQWFSKVGNYERFEIPEELFEQGLSQSQFNEAYGSVINFGIGTEIYLSERIRMIGSMSSDFNAHNSSVSILDQFSTDEKNVNVFGDFWHFGFGTEISTNWGEIVLGATYSRTSVDFNDEDTPISIGQDNNLDNVLNRLSYQRYRIIFGIEIPFLKEKIKNLKGIVN
ncbi:MAG: hypothetical protein HRU26_15925 [Psychroserpens sp.]|nr:hypothetical protein [Psychroserpens sp.]